MNRQRIHKRAGGRVKVEIVLANPIEKARLLQNHDITICPMGRFALGTLSKACSEDAVLR